MLERLKNIFNKKNKTESIEVKAQEFEKRQAEIKAEYEKYGPTDEIIEKQIKLNQDRNKYNISDPTKRIYKNFVQ